MVWAENDFGVSFREVDIPAELEVEAAAKREEMVEKVAETDDLLMDKYLREEEITPEEIRKGIRRAALGLQITPVFCGAAYKNRGVQSLLDAVVHYLPSPADIPPVAGKDPRNGQTVLREASDREPLSALVFKIHMDEGRKLSYLRVYSGKIKAESVVYNAGLGERERLARLFLMHANQKKRIQEAGPGDIVAATGLKNVRTGDTLCIEEAPVALEPMTFYEPVISIAIEPKSIADEEKLMASLEKLATEDPTFRYRFDDESGQILISGMGELHLSVLVQRLTREFQVQASVGRPQVVYRETITLEHEESGEFSREVGGKMQHGEVVLRVAPRHRGKGNAFVSALSGDGGPPPEYVQAVEAAFRESCASGSLGGYPVVDVELNLVSAAYREGVSTPLGFRIATATTFQRVYEKASPILLEPVMTVDIVIPEEYSSGVIGDIQARKGKVLDVSPKKRITEIRASIPLSRMFGYSTDLRSSSKGRGTFTMQFERFDDVQEKPRTG